MSRSYRVPWVKDKGTYWKKVCSRMHRHIGRQICHTYCKSLNVHDFYCTFWCTCDWDEDNLPCGYCSEMRQFPLRNELINQWDLCDRRFYSEDPVYKRK